MATSVDRSKSGTFPEVDARTVGSGGRYTTIAAAVADITEFSRIALRGTFDSQTITKTNGSATITGSGTSWMSNADKTKIVGAEDLVLFGSDTRYYKIKSVDSGTQLTLYEPYAGTTAGPTSQNFTTHYLKRLTLALLPGTHHTNGATLNLYPGVDLVGYEKEATFVQEDAIGVPVFNSTSDNRISNLSFSPNGPDSTWGDMDGITNTVLSTIWGGAEFEMSNCKIVRSNLRGVHPNGALRLPYINGGKATFSDLDIWIDGPGSFISSGTVSPTNGNTKIVLNNVLIRRILGHDITLANNGVSNYGIHIDSPLTLDLNNVHIDIPESNTNPFIGNIVGISVQDGVVNANDVFIRITNTSGTAEKTYGIEVLFNPSTINLGHCDIEANGTGAVGIYQNIAGSVVNVRTGTRIKGSTSSINCAAGTINVSGNADLIGATTGVGTINLATAT